MFIFMLFIFIFMLCFSYLCFLSSYSCYIFHIYAFLYSYSSYIFHMHVFIFTFMLYFSHSCIYTHIHVIFSYLWLCYAWFRFIHIHGIFSLHKRIWIHHFTFTFSSPKSILCFNNSRQCILAWSSCLDQPRVHLKFPDDVMSSITSTIAIILHQQINR